MPTTSCKHERVGTEGSQENGDTLLLSVYCRDCHATGEVEIDVHQIEWDAVDFGEEDDSE